MIWLYCLLHPFVVAGRGQVARVLQGRFLAEVVLRRWSWYESRLLR